MLRDKVDQRFLLIGAGIVLFFVLGKFQFLTGDETRYLLYSYSISNHGRIIMTELEWADLYRRSTGMSPIGLPLINGALLGHPVFVPALLAPIAHVFLLGGLRAASLIAGLAGLWALLRLTTAASSSRPWTAAASVAIAAFSIPLLPYLHLFYMEVFIFALAAYGWYRIHFAPRTRVSTLITAVIILLLPFAHLRASVVAVALYGLLLLRLRQEMPGLWWRQVVPLVALGGAFAALLVGANLAIYGAISGSVNTARPPLPWDTFPVISMQLFNVRHGLLAYAPVWIFGFAGLCAGSTVGDRFCREGLLLLLVASFTSIGPNPGECWPARFWILSVPMLTIGLCWWLGAARSRLHRAITVGLVLATLVNTVFFLVGPNIFLENRQTTATYQLMFNRFGVFDFGLMLPVEINEALNTDLARNLTIAAVVMVALLCLSLARRTFAWIALLMALGVLDIGRVRELPPSDYTVTAERWGMHLSFARPVTSSVYVQIGQRWQTWFIPPEWPMLRIVVQDGASRGAEWRIAANQVIGATCRDGLVSLDIDAQGDAQVLTEMGNTPRIYESRSFLRLLTGLTRLGCRG